MKTPETQQRPKTVLVVDDESHISHIVSLKLQQAGLKVLIATDGEEAFDIACEHHPDLIVTDFQMPYMSGLELGMKLRQTPGLEHIPVLMVTARGHLLPADEMAKTNIKAVMCKPFGPRHLLEKVLDMLSGAAPLPTPLPVPRTPGAAAA